MLHELTWGGHQEQVMGVHLSFLSPTIDARIHIPQSLIIACKIFEGDGSDGGIIGVSPRIGGMGELMHSFLIALGTKQSPKVSGRLRGF